MRHVIDVDWGQTVDIAPDMKLTFHNAGHILGSSSVHLRLETASTTLYSLATKNTRNHGCLMQLTQDSQDARHLLSNQLTVPLGISSLVEKRLLRNSRILLAEPSSVVGS